MGIPYDIECNLEATMNEILHNIDALIGVVSKYATNA